VALQPTPARARVSTPAPADQPRPAEDLATPDTAAQTFTALAIEADQVATAAAAEVAATAAAAVAIEPTADLAAATQPLPDSTAVPVPTPEPVSLPTALPAGPPADAAVARGAGGVVVLANLNVVGREAAPVAAAQSTAAAPDPFDGWPLLVGLTVLGAAAGALWLVVQRGVGRRM
jgi:hypothetical protein